MQMHIVVATFVSPVVASHFGPTQAHAHTDTLYLLTANT